MRNLVRTMAVAVPLMLAMPLLAQPRSDPPMAAGLPAGGGYMQPGNPDRGVPNPRPVPERQHRAERRHAEDCRHQDRSSRRCKPAHHEQR